MKVKTPPSYITTNAYDEIPINRCKQIPEDHYIKIWNEIYVKSESASHTKLCIPTIFHRLSFTLWPSFLLTQFLTNHGSFRSYLYKMNKTTSPYCNCPAKTVQTARHLPLEYSLWSKDLLTFLKSLPTALGSAISHKHRHHHKLPQTHLPSTPRRRPRKINLTILFMYTANITAKTHCKAL